MFEKRKLASRIKKYKAQILAVEQKRIRSQAALVEAILTHQVPSDEDVDYFNKFTAEINTLRIAMHEMQERYDAMAK